MYTNKCLKEISNIKCVLNTFKFYKVNINSFTYLKCQLIISVKFNLKNNLQLIFSLVLPRNIHIKFYIIQKNGTNKETALCV